MTSDRFDKFTERARKVLTLAQEEATRFNHNYIGTEHLLLGLVREGEGVAAKVLANLGVELNRVRSAVEFIIGRGDRMIVGEVGLTPRAKKVIELAVDEARRLGHHYIGTEHLLLGLVREGEGIAAGVLESVGINLENVRAQTIRVLSTSMPIGSTDAEGNGESGGEGATPRAGIAEALREWSAGMPTRGARARWEYLIVEVTQPEPDGSPVVRRLHGQNDERFGRDVMPIHVALQTLGIEGWEMVAVDRPAQTGGQATSRYVFKRPAQ